MTRRVYSVRRRRILSRIGLYVALVVGIVYVAFPFYWLTMSSLSPRDELFSPRPLPSALTLANYQDLLANSAVLVYLRNSVVVALVVTAVTIVVAVLGSYSFVFFNYPLRESIARLILFTYMFPGVIIVVPTFQLMARLRMIDSLLGIVLVEMVLTVPFCTWMLRSFFLQVPRELLEAGLIDGASRLRILFSIVVPTVRPGIIASSVFAFIFSWNEYLFPLVLVNNDALKTLPLGVAGFMGHLFVEWGPLLASGVISVVPILVLFILLQRYLVSGLTAGALKG